MHIPHPNSGISQIVGQILRHLFRQRGDQNTLIPRGAGLDLIHQIIDLPLNRADFHAGIQQTGGADHLLHHIVRAASLIGAGSCGHKHSLTDPLLKFLKLQGAVIVGTGQTETVFHKAVLAGAVAVIHGSHLWQRYMALIHKQQEIVREEVQQRHGCRAGRPLGNDAGVVLNTGAVAQFRHHLHVIFGSLADALCLHQLIVFGKILNLLLQFRPDLAQRPIHFVLGGDIMAGRIDGNMVQDPVHIAGQGVEIADAVDLISKEFHTDGVVFIVSGIDLHRVAPDTEVVALKGNVIALIANFHKTAEQIVPVPLRTHAKRHHQFCKIIRFAQTVNAGNGGHHDHIPSFQQGAGGAQTQAVDLIIGGRILGDIGIRVGDIRLGLVVIVIGYEVFHRVVGEKLLELCTQLSRQSLIVCQNQRGPLGLLNHFGHGKGLAGTGNAQQNLLLQAVLNSFCQRGNCLRLITGRPVFRNNFKFRHAVLLSRLTGIRCLPWTQRFRPQ